MHGATIKIINVWLSLQHWFGSHSDSPSSKKTVVIPLFAFVPRFNVNLLSR